MCLFIWMRITLGGTLYLTQISLLLIFINSLMTFSLDFGALCSYLHALVWTSLLLVCPGFLSWFTSRSCHGALWCLGSLFLFTMALGLLLLFEILMTFLVLTSMVACLPSCHLTTKFVLWFFQLIDGYVHPWPFGFFPL